MKLCVSCFIGMIVMPIIVMTVLIMLIIGMLVTMLFVLFIALEASLCFDNATSCSFRQHK